ncbi:hypothetical protein LVJ94_08465 [Pendulispora rubella]|uniref:Uncharacterized protein n=1 Tax=Pendulispora rubella TaxID=2741070 RepID=A0ABZ2L8K1_9BACT
MTTLGELFSVASARRVLAAVTATALATATLTVSPGVARADEVSPDGKGIAGGALLGAEVVTIPMSLFKVKSPWAYVIGGGLGAVGGGFAGYAIEQASFSDDGRVPTYMLAGGLALVIPAVVLVLNATRYQPSDAASEDRAPTNAPPADPGRPGGGVVLEGGGSATTPPPSPPPSTPPATSPAKPPAVPMSLLDLHRDAGFRMGIPLPQVRESYSLQERKQLGVQQVTELRLPIFKATF